MKRSYELGVGCLLFFALAVTGFMAIQIGAWSGFRATTSVRVPMVDAAGLSQGAAVSIAGVPVGSVETLALDGDRAIMVLAVDSSASLREGTTARIRARSVLGEKYVELVPGPVGGPPLASGAELPQLGPQTEIDELVAVMGPLLDALDPEAVSAAVSALSDALQEDPERLARMLDNLDNILEQGSDAADELPELIADGKGLMRGGRRMLSALESRAAEARGVLVKAEDALESIEGAADQAPEAIAEARAAVADARRTLAHLEGAAADVEAMLDGFDPDEIERLMRDEGVRVRFFGRKKRD